MTCSTARQHSRQSSLSSDTTRSITRRRVLSASTAQSTSVYPNTWRSTSIHIQAWNHTPATSALSSSGSAVSSHITRGLAMETRTRTRPRPTSSRTTCKSYRITKCKRICKVTTINTRKAISSLDGSRMMKCCLLLDIWELRLLRTVTELEERLQFLKTSSSRCTSRLSSNLKDNKFARWDHPFTLKNDNSIRQDQIKYRNPYHMGEFHQRHSRWWQAPSEGWAPRRSSRHGKSLLMPTSFRGFLTNSINRVSEWKRTLNARCLSRQVQNLETTGWESLASKAHIHHKRLHRHRD